MASGGKQGDEKSRERGRRGRPTPLESSSAPGPAEEDTAFESRSETWATLLLAGRRTPRRRPAVRPGRRRRGDCVSARSRQLLGRTSVDRHDEHAAVVSADRDVRRIGSGREGADQVVRSRMGRCGVARQRPGPQGAIAGGREEWAAVGREGEVLDELFVRPPAPGVRREAARRRCREARRHEPAAAGIEGQSERGPVVGSDRGRARGGSTRFHTRRTVGRLIPEVVSRLRLRRTSSAPARPGAVRGEWRGALAGQTRIRPRRRTRRGFPVGLSVVSAPWLHGRGRRGEVRERSAPQCSRPAGTLEVSCGIDVTPPVRRPTIRERRSSRPCRRSQSGAPASDVTPSG